MNRTKVLLMIVAVLLGLIWALLELGGGTGRGDFAGSAQHAVEAQGYTNVQYAGVDNIACGQTAGFAFDANNVNGARVHLVACSPNGLVNYTTGWQIVTR